MTHGEYAIAEFVQRLAAVEEKFANELRSVTECFYQSRLDLPAKKLDDIGKVRARAAKHLKKIDKKKSDAINLWKICNIYSSCAVDTDNAMRDVRKSLRKIIVKSEKAAEKEKDYNLKINGNAVTPMRRLGDDYRPTTPTKPSKSPRQKRKSFGFGSVSMPIGYTNDMEIPPEPEIPHEIYDKHKPTQQEQHRTLELWRQKIEQNPNATKEEKERPTLQHSKSLAPSERRLVKENSSKTKQERFIEQRPSLKANEPPSLQIRSTPQIFKPESLPPKPKLRGNLLNSVEDLLKAEDTFQTKLEEPMDTTRDEADSLMVLKL